MVKLFEKERDRLVAEITEDQFRFLADHLEEESENDQDYYLNMDTLDFLEEEGADAELMGALRGAMAGREEIELRWAPEPH
ncbi:MAG: galactosyldiacylglycerol synthase [Deltaproteobacteria bacterium]|nr:galactosyldiacylglycerol synthase [Deltaproteobacteria bacterium]